MSDKHLCPCTESCYLQQAMDSSLTLESMGDFIVREAAEERFSITVQVDKSSHEVSVSSIRINDDSVGVGGKGTVDVSDYSHVHQPVLSASPAFDAEGKVLP